MKYKKYPRTFHLPFSKGSTSDDKFLKDYFNKSVAKYVRANHVTTNSHWMYQEMKINKLGGN